jgi:hypothetical protein
MDSTRIIADPGDKRYEYYPLENEYERLLPDEHELVLNTASGYLVLIDWDQRRVRAECHVTDLEFLVIKQFLDDWPIVTPYEKLLPLIFSKQLTEQIRQCLQEAHHTSNARMYALALEPLRTILKGCQKLLEVFHIKISAVYQHGYRLIEAKQSGEQQEQEL